MWNCLFGFQQPFCNNLKKYSTFNILFTTLIFFTPREDTQSVTINIYLKSDLPFPNQKENACKRLSKYDVLTYGKFEFWYTQAVIPNAQKIKCEQIKSDRCRETKTKLRNRR